MADDDGRGRVTALRQFVKDWAASDDDRHHAMNCDAPKRHRAWHRLGPRRYDLAKVEAAVDGLCKRDGIEVPAWVHAHRPNRPVSLTASPLRPSDWTDWVRPRATATTSGSFPPIWTTTGCMASADHNPIPSGTLFDASTVP